MINFGSVPTRVRLRPEDACGRVRGRGGRLPERGRGPHLAHGAARPGEEHRSSARSATTATASSSATTPPTPAGRSVTVHAIAVDEDDSIARLRRAERRRLAACPARRLRPPCSSARATAAARGRGSARSPRSGSSRCARTAPAARCTRSARRARTSARRRQLQHFPAPGGARFTSGSLGRDPRSGVVFAYATLPLSRAARRAHRRSPGLRRRRAHVARGERRACSTPCARPARARSGDRRRARSRRSARSRSRRSFPLEAYVGLRGLAASRPRREAVQRHREDDGRRQDVERRARRGRPALREPRRPRGSSRVPPRTATRCGSTRPTTSRSRRTTRPSPTRPTSSARTARRTAAGRGRR